MAKTLEVFLYAPRGPPVKQKVTFGHKTERREMKIPVLARRTVLTVRRRRNKKPEAI